MFLSSTYLAHRMESFESPTTVLLSVTSFMNPATLSMRLLSQTGWGGTTCCEMVEDATSHSDMSVQLPLFCLAQRWTESIGMTQIVLTLRKKDMRKLSLVLENIYEIYFTAKKILIFLGDIKWNAKMNQENMFRSK